jgi:hypothetical protein
MEKNVEEKYAEKKERKEKKIRKRIKILLLCHLHSFVVQEIISQERFD